jgi:error-prone DNA polymerase
MEQYVGLDVSLKDTAISIRQDGERIWRGKCPSDPQILAQVIRKHAPHASRVVSRQGHWQLGSITHWRPKVCLRSASKRAMRHGLRY